MLYYDIHTHQRPEWTEETEEQRAVVNRIVGDEPFETLRRSLNDGAAWHSAGIHPWYIYNVKEQLRTLRRLLEEPTVVAVGEAGLDRLAAASMPLQQEVFRAQARLAEEFRKPLIIHCVKAWQELLANKQQLRPSMPWIVHGFRGNSLLAAQLVDKGFYLSFGEKFFVPALQVAWPSHLLAETDEWRGGIRAVYASLSASLQIPEEELALQIESQLKSRIFAGTV